MFLPDLTDQLRAFLAHGLMLDPWLAGLAGEYFSFESQDTLSGAADALAGRHGSEPLIPQMPLINQLMADLQITSGLGRSAAIETLNSTAAVIAHDRVGQIRVDRPIADEAVRRLDRFVECSGFAALVWVYVVVTVSENHNALAHYGAIPEDEFVRGVRHRPWVRGSLADELQMGLAAGSYQIAIRDGRRWVEQTADGQRTHRAARRMLAESGYLRERLRLVQISHFNLLADYDRDFALEFPGGGPWRQAFTSFAGLDAGSCVIEVGCGTGAQTFEGGLHGAVGSSGLLVGLDPSIAMLAHAKRKALDRGVGNVEFVQGRAEALPFTDRSFDAAVGMGFMQFTEAPRAVAEMVRVTRPRGTLAVGAGCRFQSAAPWFQDWFSPLLDLVGRDNPEANPILLPPGELTGLFCGAGLERVECARRLVRTAFAGALVGVSTLLHTVPGYQEALGILPWAARCELLRELAERGEAVCRRTTLEERTSSFPTEHVRGIVPAAGPAARGGVWR